MGDRDETVTLITGANSGLGYAIAARIIVEFFVDNGLTNRDPGLVICVATRSVQKSEETINQLSEFVKKKLANKFHRRLRFDHVEIDLSSLHSVTAAATELRKKYRRIHHVFCNAGVVPFVRLDWIGAAKQMAMDFVGAMTYPRYKVQGVGWLTDAHKSLLSESIEGDQAGGSAASSVPSDLGAVFAANVFGHYYLVHEIMDILHAPSQDAENPSRVIWIGSIESNSEAFELEDIQGLKTGMPYESSKTLIDILVLGSSSPEAQQYLKSYTASARSIYGQTVPPVFLLAHPGIVSTPIIRIPWWQSEAKMIGFRICRLLGSPWHCLDPYIGASAPVWVALSLHLSAIKGKKWGSGWVWSNGEIILETAVDADVDGLAKSVWSEMEQLRVLWKSRLDRVAQYS